MKYCHHCGRQIADHANYCEKCGTQQTQPIQTNNQVPHDPVSPYHPHCPKCRSKDVAPAVEGQTVEGNALFGFTQAGIGLGSFNSKTNVEYDWMCQNCGKRFPNIHVIEKKIKNYSTYPSLARMCTIIAAICAVIFAFKKSWIVMQICLVCVVIYGLVWLFTKKHLESLQEDLMFWKASCYDRIH